MKKFIALGLASAMVMSMGAVASAKKDEDILYPVGSISTNAYGYDDDVSAVDLASALDTIPYGKTLYYPLLNSVTNADSDAAIAAAQTLLNEKQAAFELSVNKHSEAIKNAADKASASKTAQELLDKANAVKSAAQAWNDAVLDSGNPDQLKNAYIAALAAYDAAMTPAATGADALTGATALVNQNDAANDTAKLEETAANELVVTRNTEMTNAETARNEAQKALADLKASTFGYVHESDAIDGIKLKTKWEMGAKHVDSVEIAKKKVTGITTDQKYLYFVAISLKDNSSMTANDLTGTIQLRKSGSFDYDEMELDVNVELSYPHATEAVITEDPQIFKEGEGFAGEDDEEFTFEVDSDSYFTVNTIGQSKLLLAASTDFDSQIADLYPHANLDFFYGNGATFNKTGTLTLAAEEGAYLYKVNEKGNLELTNAEYDEYDEAFVIRTKALGQYVVSDVELELVEKPSNDNSNNDNNSGNNNGGNVTIVPNPGTGAVA